jgi:hypothetical protein
VSQEKKPIPVPVEAITPPVVFVGSAHPNDAEKQIEIYRAAVRIWCMRGERDSQTGAVDAAIETWDIVKKKLAK